MLVGNGDLAVVEVLPVFVEALLVVWEVLWVLGEVIFILGLSLEGCSISPSVPPPGSSLTEWSVGSSVCLG